MRTLLEDASETSSLCSVTCLIPPEDGVTRQTPGAVASKLRKVALNPNHVMKVNINFYYFYFDRFFFLKLFGGFLNTNKDGENVCLLKAKGKTIYKDLKIMILSL